MQDVNVGDVPLTRAANLRANLRRIFDFHPRGYQAHIAREANITTVYLSNIVRNGESNPTIEKIEGLSIALEIPVETLLSANPSDADLRILSDSGGNPS